MRPFANFHLHSTGSDGAFSPEHVIKECIKDGLKHICFTDHYPVPPGVREWMKGFHSEEYYLEIQRLIKEYKGKINISFGAEFDWLEDHESWIKDHISKRKYDFIIGSVHLLKSKEGEGGYDPFSWTPELLEKLSDEYGGIKQLIHEYYDQVRKMIRSGMYDCVGHLDLIKLLNRDSCFFSEDKEWYRDEVFKTLHEIAKSGMCMEINTSGWTKAQECYPSRWIIEEAKKRNIIITIGSDGHRPPINKDLDRAFNLAKEVGYDSIAIFKNRKRKMLKFSDFE